MITTKQRSTLSGLAQKLEPLFQIGKNGVTADVVNAISEALDARELIKISILRNSELESKEVLSNLCQELNADPVSAIGFKIVLYRFSNKTNAKHIMID